MHDPRLWLLSLDNQILDPDLKAIYQLSLNIGEFKFENKRDHLSIDAIVASSILGGLRGYALHKKIGRILELRIACSKNKECKVFSYCLYDANLRRFLFGLCPSCFCSCRMMGSPIEPHKLLIIS